MYKLLGIILILSACQNTTLKQQVIPVFNKYIELDAQADQTKYGTLHYTKAHNVLMNYRFGEYTKALTLFSKSYCVKANKKVLDKFIEVLIATKGSVYEPRTNILGKVYACHPQPIINAINNLKRKERLDIVSDLENGLKHEVYIQDGKIKNYKQLYDQLINLRLSL